MSTDLQWLLLRKNSSFIVKGIQEGPILSKEPGNLRNLHSHKYSGLANLKTIDIRDSGSNLIITTRKTTASPHAVRKARITTNLRAGSGSRRAHGVVAQSIKRGYRPDLRQAALARVSALQGAKKEPKPTPPKKVRGKKALDV